MKGRCHMNLDVNKVEKIEKEESIQDFEWFKSTKAYHEEMIKDINQLKAIFTKENS